MSFSWTGILLLSGNDEQFVINMYFVRIAKWHSLWVLPTNADRSLLEEERDYNPKEHYIPPPALPIPPLNC